MNQKRLMRSSVSTNRKSAHSIAVGSVATLSMLALVGGR